MIPLLYRWIHLKNNNVDRAQIDKRPCTTMKCSPVGPVAKDTYNNVHDIYVFGTKWVQVKAIALKSPNKLFSLYIYYMTPCIPLLNWTNRIANIPSVYINEPQFRTHFPITTGKLGTVGPWRPRSINQYR